MSAAEGNSTTGDTYQFFVPPASLSPGIVFAGFELPGEVVFCVFCMWNELLRAGLNDS